MGCGDSGCRTKDILRILNCQPQFDVEHDRTDRRMDHRDAWIHLNISSVSIGRFFSTQVICE